MIENISGSISYPAYPAMISHSDMTYRTLGIAGPAIFFLDSYHTHRSTDLDPVDDA